MKIEEMIDAAAYRRQLFPPRVIHRGERVIDRVSTDRSMNSSGGDYDEWHKPFVVSADPTHPMPIGMEFMGIGRTGRAFYTWPGYQSSSDWFEMCPACGRYSRTRGEWGFCASCDSEDDWQDANGVYSLRSTPDGEYTRHIPRQSYRAEHP